MQDKSLTRIPVSLTAKSDKELTKKMLEINLAFGLEFQYFDIQKDGNQWVAWYYFDIDRYKKV